MANNKFTIITFLILCFISTSAFGATFKGKVIDADTKEPIEGAVVVASWLEERADVAGSTSEPKDVKETLTDKNGEWIIKGPKGRDMGNITAIFTFLTGTYITTPPKFIVFKPEYCSWHGGFEIEACKMKPSGIGDGETIELRKLTNREDRLRAIPSTAWGELEKQRELIRLINEERRNLGLKGEIYFEEIKK